MKILLTNGLLLTVEDQSPQWMIEDNRLKVWTNRRKKAAVDIPYAQVAAWWFENEADVSIEDMRGR